MLQKPSAILFDWDLTLSDNFSAIVKSYNHVLTRFAMAPWSKEKIRAATAFSLKDNFTRIFGADKWQEAAGVFRECYAEIHIAETKLIDGAYETLDLLKNKYGCPFGVVSNKTPLFLREEIDYVGLGDIMDVIVGAGEASADKPSPAPVLMAIEKLGLSAGKHIWYIGDTISDAKAGIAAGCTTIMITEPDEAIEQENPDVYVGSIAELRKLVLDI